MSKDKMGKGVDGLFDSIKISRKTEKDEKKSNNNGVNNIKIDDIIENTHQPRTNFNDESLINLSLSIKENGILQPITVIERGNGKYELIAGERRLRASKLAGLLKIPAIIMEVDENKKSVLALIENIQRENLNPMEVAAHLKRMIDEFKYTHDTISKKIGMPRSNVSNLLRLINLPDETKQLISEEKISMGHAKILVSLKDNDYINELSNLIVLKGLSVSKLDKLIKSKSEESKDLEASTATNTELSNETIDAINNIEKYNVKFKNKKITFSFENEDEIKDFIKLISKK